MSGGLIELAAKGEQDKFLIGSPQFSYFKSVYKRHTNFSSESKTVFFNETIEYNKVISAVIPKQGDLINNILIQVDLEEITDPEIGYVNNIGFTLIEYINIYIGNTLIDSHTGDWLNIWSELTTSSEKKLGLENMIKKYPFEFHNNFNPNKGGKLLIPLYFWFQQKNFLSLPLVALQYHDVKIEIKLPKFEKVWKSFDGSKPNKPYKINSMNLLIDYVYLDSEERKFFAQNNHQYLFKQLQINKNNNVSKNNSEVKISLKFKHPVTELFWIVKRKNVRDTKDWFNYSDSNVIEYKDPILSSQILINGMDRTFEMDNIYNRVYQPFKHHTNIPDTFIYMYSFALFPEKYEPSGACNLSHVDNCTLKLKMKPNLDDCEVIVFAINYNLLRIQCGMGGVAYIN